MRSYRQIVPIARRSGWCTGWFRLNPGRQSIGLDKVAAAVCGFRSGWRAAAERGLYLL